MCKYLSISVLVLLSTVTWSQDTLVSVNHLSFRSSLEKEVLTAHFSGNETNPFMLFMANGLLVNETSANDSYKKFQTHISSLNDEKVRNKKNDRKVKYMYDYIHNTFLKKYEERNRFEEIFQTGYYNCVSASALYALAFEELNIPYTIKELPSHVYLVAYPQGEQVKIETTSPIAGYQTIDASFKQAFVRMLKDQKLISVDEYNSTDMNTLFNKFYFGEQKDISLLNLVGIQYMNDALYRYDEEKYEEAHAQMEKGYLFIPTERSGYLLVTMASAAFDAHKERDSVQAVYLGKMSRYMKYGVTPDMIKGEFGRTVLELIFERNRKDQLDQYYRVLLNMISDKNLKDEIRYIYHYENGRLLFNQARYREAMVYFEEALRLKPDHLETSNAFVSTLARMLSSQSDNLKVISSLEGYSKRFPTLVENNIFNLFLASSYLVQFGMEYTMEKPTAGDKYRFLFEEQLQKFPDLTIQSSVIGQAYSAAAVYYFRRGQTSKAKSIIEKGLTYSPGNQELILRQQMIR